MGENLNNPRVISVLKDYNPVGIAGTLRNWFFLALFFLTLAPLNTLGQSLADSLRAVVQSDVPDSVLVEANIDLSREIHRTQHDEEEEYIFAQRAVEIARETENSLLYARTLDNLGLLYRFHQKYSDAVPLHVEAYTLIEGIQADPYYYMRFANNTGVAARYDQMYDLAVKYFLESMKVAEEENDLRNIAIASNGLGNTLINISGREEEALEYFLRALETEKERNNTLGMAINYLSISDYYSTKEMFNTSREYLEQLLAVNMEREDKFGLAITYEYFGHNYFKERINLDQALFYYRKSLEAFKLLNNQLKQADLYRSIGNVMFEETNYDTALAYFDSSNTLAVSLNNKLLLKENASAKSAVFEAMNSYQNALSFYRLSQQYSDSINLIEQETEIAAMQRRYNLERREAEIEMLEIDKSLQEAQLVAQQEEIRTHRTLLILMGVILSGIIAVSLMQYRNVKIRREANRLLQEREKQRLQAVYERNLAQTEMLAARMQINPHFLFNCLNSIKYLIQKDQNKKATSYLVVFSRFIRMVLESGNNHVIPLSEEIELIQFYLKLEENRFDEGFTYEVNLDKHPDLSQVQIPPLLLQPYVENAIWHGLLPSRKRDKRLGIDISGKNGTVKIVIDDNGVGRKQDKGNQNGAVTHKRKSMGMQITEERIELFNKNYDFDISCEIIDKKDIKGKPKGTQVVINLAKTEETTMSG